MVTRFVEIFSSDARPLTDPADRFSFAAARTTDVPDSSNCRNRCSSSVVHFAESFFAIGYLLFTFSQLAKRPDLHIIFSGDKTEAFHPDQCGLLSRAI